MLIYNDPTESQTIAVFFSRKTSFCFLYLYSYGFLWGPQTYVAIFSEYANLNKDLVTTLVTYIYILFS